MITLTIPYWVYLTFTALLTAKIITDLILIFQRRALMRVAEELDADLSDAVNRLERARLLQTSRKQKEPAE